MFFSHKSVFFQLKTRGDLSQNFRHTFIIWINDFSDMIFFLYFKNALTAKLLVDLWESAENILAIKKRGSVCEKRWKGSNGDARCRSLALLDPLGYFSSRQVHLRGGHPFSYKWKLSHNQNGNKLMFIHSDQRFTSTLWKVQPNKSLFSVQSYL